MPRSPYADRRDELVAEICRRLAAGAPLVEVCRAPGMPTWGTLMAWQRDDPALKARFRAARTWTWQRDPAAREHTILRLCEDLERGRTLHRACGEPRAPNYHTVLRWMRADPALRERLRRAQAWGVQVRPRYNQDRYRYDYGRVDRFLARVRGGASVVSLQATGEAPDQETIRAWKHMRPEFVEQYDAARRAGAAARRARSRRPFDPDVADRIVARVNRGETLAVLMREPRMPGWTALGRWRRAQPGFAAALALALRGGRKRRARAASSPSPELTAASARPSPPAPRSRPSAPAPTCLASRRSTPGAAASRPSPKRSPQPGISAAGRAVGEGRM